MLVDGNVVGTFTPSSGSYALQTTSSFTVTAGAHTLEFRGLTTGDSTAFIDQVSIQATTGAETTSYAYTFFTDTTRAQQITTTLPVVSTAQNGPGTADVSDAVFDINGRAIWTRDENGFLNYFAYDEATGTLTKQIIDVDATQTGDFQDKPTGWTTPTGGGLHLITTMEVDDLGRDTKIVQPNGNITYLTGSPMRPTAEGTRSRSEGAGAWSSSMYCVWLCGRFAAGPSSLCSLDPASENGTSWRRRCLATPAFCRHPGDQAVELWAGVEQALQVAKLGQYVPDGVQFERYQRDALRSSPNDSRPSAELHLTAGAARIPLVLAVSKKDGGVAFGKWYEVLVEALGKSVPGAVVVWPKAKRAVGKTAKAFGQYQEQVARGTIRPFPLDDNIETFAQLESLRRLIADAQASMAVVGGKTLTPDECRSLLVETKVLAELPLFEIIFWNWPAVDATRAKSPTAPSAASSPTAPTAPAGTASAGPLPQAAHARPAAVAISMPVGVVPPTIASPPAGGRPWAEEMLEKVVEKLRSRGQPVRPLEAEVGPTFVRLKVEPTRSCTRRCCARAATALPRS